MFIKKAIYYLCCAILGILTYSVFAQATEATPPPVPDTWVTQIVRDITPVIMTALTAFITTAVGWIVLKAHGLINQIKSDKARAATEKAIQMGVALAVNKSNDSKAQNGGKLPEHVQENLQAEALNTAAKILDANPDPKVTLSNMTPIEQKAVIVQAVEANKSTPTIVIPPNG